MFCVLSFDRDILGRRSDSFCLKNCFAYVAMMSRPRKLGLIINIAKDNDRNSNAKPWLEILPY